MFGTVKLHPPPFVEIRGPVESLLQVAPTNDVVSINVTGDSFDYDGLVTNIDLYVTSMGRGLAGPIIPPSVLTGAPAPTGFTRWLPWLPTTAVTPMPRRPRGLSRIGLPTNLPLPKRCQKVKKVSVPAIVEY